MSPARRRHLVVPAAGAAEACTAAAVKVPAACPVRTPLCPSERPHPHGARESLGDSRGSPLGGAGGAAGAQWSRCSPPPPGPWALVTCRRYRPHLGLDGFPSLPAPTGSSVWAEGCLEPAQPRQLGEARGGGVGILEALARRDLCPPTQRPGSHPHSERQHGVTQPWPYRLWTGLREPAPRAQTVRKPPALEEESAPIQSRILGVEG